LNFSEKAPRKSQEAFEEWKKYQVKDPKSFRGGEENLGKAAHP
jgi:hypothetical protein